jgi:cyclophilin family peptidyl-prolyl cis-trans isomerase
MFLNTLRFFVKLFFGKTQFILNRLKTMKYLTTLLLLSFLTVSVQGQEKPVVNLHTNEGTIIIELNPDKAPQTSANFLRYVQDGFYEHTIFHRVIQGYVLQGGGYTKDYDRKLPTYEPVLNESNNGLTNKRGTVAMARNPYDPDSATTQFFINLKDNTALDAQEGIEGSGYTVFGRIIESMDVVNQIQRTRTSAKGPFKRHAPKKDIIIERITLENLPDKLDSSNHTQEETEETSVSSAEKETEEMPFSSAEEEPEETSSGFDKGESEETSSGLAEREAEETSGGFDDGEFEETSGGFDKGESEETSGGFDKGESEETSGGFDKGESEETSSGLAEREAEETSLSSAEEKTEERLFSSSEKAHFSLDEGETEETSFGSDEIETKKMPFSSAEEEPDETLGGFDKGESEETSSGLAEREAEETSVSSAEEKTEEMLFSSSEEAHFSLDEGETEETSFGSDELETEEIFSSVEEETEEIAFGSDEIETEDMPFSLAEPETEETSDEMETEEMPFSSAEQETEETSDEMKTEEMPFSLAEPETAETAFGSDEMEPKEMPFSSAEQETEETSVGSADKLTKIMETTKTREKINDTFLERISTTKNQNEPSKVIHKPAQIQTVLPTTDAPQAQSTTASQEAESPLTEANSLVFVPTTVPPQDSSAYPPLKTQTKIPQDNEINVNLPWKKVFLPPDPPSQPAEPVRLPN